MHLREFAVSGAFELVPDIHTDERGDFLEWLRVDELAEAIGHPFTLAQANCSVSVPGTLRGVHFAEVPPGQAKYVTCMRGAVFDVVVDIRVGSPNFGGWDAAVLDDRTRKAVYVSEGLGHAFMALEDGSVVSYLCSTPYAPGREHGVDPLDPELGIDWPATGRDGRSLMPLLSDKDRAAPSLQDARAAGLLPEFAEVQRYLAGLRQDVR
jgi:dTDP-4-dehydrorhamnose 3,5-epimerase